MARIFLIRHGQASFGAEDYDALSDLGHRQAHALGEALMRNGLTGISAWCGDMRRHRETLEGCMKSFEPISPLVDTRWNEFDHVDIIRGLYPNHGSSQDLLSELVQAENPYAAFQRLFEAAVARWVGGQHDSDYAESWEQFRGRVTVAFLHAAEESAKGRDVVVVTSGGVIAVAMMHLLGLEASVAMALNWSIGNAGVTSFHVGRTLRLVSFNELGHLRTRDSELVTYR